MGVVSWIIIGVVAGWAASQIMRRTASGEIVFTMVVGVLGAAAGGIITNLVIRQPVLGWHVQNAFVAILAAVVFLAVWSAVRSR